MTYGLGALQSPPDERDFPIDQLYGAGGALMAPTPASALPSAFVVPVLPPVNLDQGSSPRCVAYSAATEQSSFDLAQLGHTYAWDEPYFFQKIGGGPNGAVIRNAFKMRQSYGYPLLPSHSGNSHASHRIKAYYAVLVQKDALRQAIHDFGVVVLGLPWYNSWFTPGPDGTLPPADYQVGGHAICAVGWGTKGFALMNTWGTDWGQKGVCTLPYAYLSVVWEAWKAVDL